MPEVTIVGVPGCVPECGEEGERGKRGKRGKRGRRGHDGHGHDGKHGKDGHDGRDGHTGPTGPAGFTGFTGPTGPGVDLVESAWAMKWSGLVVQGPAPVTQSLADPGTEYSPGDFTRNRYPFCGTHVATCVAIRTETLQGVLFGNATVRIRRNDVIVFAAPAPAAGTATFELMPPIVFAPTDDIEVEVALPASPTVGNQIGLTVVVEFEGPRGPTGPQGPAGGPTGPQGAPGLPGTGGGLLKWSGSVVGVLSEGVGNALVGSYLPDAGIGISGVRLAEMDPGQANPSLVLAQRYPLPVARTLINFATNVQLLVLLPDNTIGPGPIPVGGTLQVFLEVNGSFVAFTSYGPANTLPTPTGDHIEIAPVVVPVAPGDTIDVFVATNGFIAAAVGVSAMVGVA